MERSVNTTMDCSRFPVGRSRERDMVEPTSHLFIVEDNVPVLDSIVAMFMNSETLAHPFQSAEAFLASAPHQRPGCLIVDLCLPSISGEQLFCHLTDHINPMPVIVITGFATVSVSVRLMEQGVMTLLEKPIDPKTLRSYIDKAIEYDKCQLEMHSRFRDLQRCWNGLSERQRHVLQLIVDGLPSKAMAPQLEVSQRTIEIERSRLLATFEVESTPELVAKSTEFHFLTTFGYQGRAILRKHAASSTRPVDDKPL